VNDKLKKVVKLIGGFQFKCGLASADFKIKQISMLKECTFSKTMFSRFIGFRLSFPSFEGGGWFGGVGS